VAETPDNERRRNQRVEVDLTTTLGGTLADYKPIELRIRDLSAGGIGFESDQKLTLGEVIEFELPVPPAPVPTKAFISWASESGPPYKYGAYLREFDQLHRNRLLRFLLARMKEKGLEPLADDVVTD
jgi:hypothetical protein